MKRILVILLLSVASLYANSYCERYTKEVSKSVLHLNSTLERNDYSSFILNYDLFIIDYNNYIGENCGSPSVQNAIKNYKIQFEQLYNILKKKGY